MNEKKSEEKEKKKQRGEKRKLKKDWKKKGKGTAHRPNIPTIVLLPYLHSFLANARWFWLNKRKTSAGEKLRKKFCRPSQNDASFSNFRKLREPRSLGIFNDQTIIARLDKRNVRARIELWNERRSLKISFCTSRFLARFQASKIPSFLQATLFYKIKHSYPRD